MDVNDFRKLWSEDKVQLTNHGLKRMALRDISIDDVENCVMNGEIIEEYPNDYPYPSALIFGRKLTGEIIHMSRRRKNLWKICERGGKNNVSVL